MILNKKILLFMFLAVILVSIGIYYSFYYKKDVTQYERLAESDNKKISRNPCLGDNEMGEYEPKKQGSSIITKIVIKEKVIGEGVFGFEIYDIDPNHYHPIELHKCGVYVVKKFNYDPKKSEQAPGFKAELWKYQYDGDGDHLIKLSEKDKAGKFKADYSYDFRVDPLEHHIVLLKGYLGSPDYALVIKDLKTLEDVFVLPMTEIEKQNKEIIGNLELDGWTRDGRYFWTATHYGAVSLGFIRVDIQNRTSDIFPAPENVLGGDALNIENGFITVHPGNVWYGVEEIEQEEKAKRRKEGVGTELYIHNLFTGERKFVVKTDEPLYFFKPKWISEDELEYEIPSGEKKIYKLEN